MEEVSTGEEKNAEYWQMLCGSMMARDLGATDFTPRSLHIFDTFFMSYYSYVYDWLPLVSMAGKDVLEVGLGYGTIGQQLAASRTNYTGLDIAKAPVDLINKRLEMFGLPGKGVQGSILDAPFEDGSFDYVVAFGSLHHTGKLDKALAEVSRLLRPGGKLIMMVYYAYSYRMWYQRRSGLVKDIWADIRGATWYDGTDSENRLYDHNDDGAPPPHTAFVSKRQIKRMAARVGLHVERIGTENAAHCEAPFTKVPRDRALKTYAKWIGGDLYAVLTKPAS